MNMNTEYTCYVQSEIKYRWANKKDFEVKLVSWTRTQELFILFPLDVIDFLSLEKRFCCPTICYLQDFVQKHFLYSSSCIPTQRLQKRVI